MKYTLNNGNKAYDLSLHPLCGANNKHGNSCRAKAMKNGRCKNHGGKTPIKHGRYSKEILDLKKKIKMMCEVVF